MVASQSGAQHEGQPFQGGQRSGAMAHILAQVGWSTSRSRGRLPALGPRTPLP